MEKSGFFDSQLVSGDPDRVYSSEDFAKYFENMFENGVLLQKFVSSNDLTVIQNSPLAMSVLVGTGMAVVRGRWYYNDAAKTITLSAANAIHPRKDNIVIELDFTARTIEAKVIEGTAASTPSAPFIQRDSSKYQLKIAEVYVAANATTIANANITDYRNNNEACGFAGASIDMTEVIEARDGFDTLKLKLDDVDAFANDVSNSIGNLENDLYPVKLAGGMLALIEINRFKNRQATALNTTYPQTIPMQRMEGTLAIASDIITLEKGFFYEFELDVMVMGTGYAYLKVYDTSNVILMPQGNSVSAPANAGQTNSVVGKSTLDLTLASTNRNIKVVNEYLDGTLNSNTMSGGLVIKKYKKVPFSNMMS